MYGVIFLRKIMVDLFVPFYSFSTHLSLFLQNYDPDGYDQRRTANVELERYFT